nr:hypothetical protein [Neisseria sp.]
MMQTNAVLKTVSAGMLALVLAACGGQKEAAAPAALPAVLSGGAPDDRAVSMDRLAPVAALPATTDTAGTADAAVDRISAFFETL